MPWQKNFNQQKSLSTIIMMAGKPISDAQRMTQAEQLQALLAALNTDETDAQQARLVQRLRERASKYAVPLRDERPQPQDRLRLISFQLGDERYAVAVTAVAGVRTIEKITRVPGVPAFYRGVTNIRGQIVSVLDLRAFFGSDGGSTGGTAAPMLPLPAEAVLVQGNDLHLALLVNRVEALLELAAESLHKVDLPYAQGITPERLIILDIAALLTDERLIIGGEEL